MRAADQLSQFVADALLAGKDRTAIAGALREAGWSEPEIDGALSAWADTDFSPPVPRPRAIVSAKEAFLYGLLFASLAVVAVCANWLGFELIDRSALSDGTDRYGNLQSRSLSDIREAISYLVVFLPVFLFLSRHVAISTRTDKSRRRSAIRKWFGYVALFIAVLVMLGDLVIAVMQLLKGDLDVEVLAKVILVFATAGLVILYVRGATAEPEDAV